MKLSKQERIGLMIIVAVVILALGAFLMVKPKAEEMGHSKETMEATKKEYEEKSAKADTKEPLREQILSAYEEGVQKADMFFEEMRPYEVEDMFREFLENRSYIKSGNTTPEDKANVLVEDLKVSDPITQSLVPSFPETEGITYPLKEFATQGGVTLSEEEQAMLARKMTLQGILGEGQTIGATTVSYTAKAISQDEFIKFADEINNFIRKENGKDVRKAMMISGITIEYPEITQKYDDMIEEITNEAKAAGEKALEENAGIRPSENSGSGSNVPTPAIDGDGAQQNELSDYLFEWDNVLTLYTVQRMQDPTPILDAQDGK